MVESSDKPQPLFYGTAAFQAPRPWGKGFLCACANLLFWGIGQGIAGFRRRAIFWFAAWLVLMSAILTAIAFPSLASALAVLFPLQLVLALVALIDAFLCGRRSARRLLGSPLLRYGAGIALIFAGWAFSVAAGTLLRATLFETFVTASPTMRPTLAPGDRFAISKRELALKRWDVVVFDSPLQPAEKWVMRIAGLPGETVEIKAGHVHVNGTKLDSPVGLGPYTDPPSDVTGNGSERHPITLGPEEYFILGDNSPVAGDSRYWDVGVGGHQPGALPRSSIKGRLIFIYWPIARWRAFP
jgi:signal peptidase I